jgi:hypothetical protein
VWLVIEKQKLAIWDGHWHWHSGVMMACLIVVRQHEDSLNEARERQH